MKTLHILLLFLILVSCKKDPIQVKNTQNQTAALTEEETTLNLWDFDGDGRADSFITDSIIKKQGKADSCILIFENHTLPDLTINGDAPVYVAQGDLDGDGRGELTLVQSSGSRCNYTLTTWSFKNREWKAVFGPRLFSTGCSGLGGRDLKSLIVKENGKLYFLDNLYNKGAETVKTEIKLR